MNKEIFNVECPYCKKTVAWSSENQYRPFCSKRCQLIDLGEWVAEEKAIPGELSDVTIDPELNKETWE